MVTRSSRKEWPAVRFASPEIAVTVPGPSMWNAVNRSTHGFTVIVDGRSTTSRERVFMQRR